MGIAQDLMPVDFRHRQVGDNQIGAIQRGLVARRQTVSKGADGMIRIAQIARNDTAKGRGIFHQEDFSHDRSVLFCGAGMRGIGAPQCAAAVGVAE